MWCQLYEPQILFRALKNPISKVFLTLQDPHYNIIPFQVIVPSTTCLWVIAIYLLAGTIIFAVWEQWSYLDSIYFCVMSLTKIGFGDLVPGTSEDPEAAMHEVKLVVNFLYILLGMALVAMCYYLLKEEVGVKMNLMRNKVRNKMAVIKQRFSSSS